MQAGLFYARLSVSNLVCAKLVKEKFTTHSGKATQDFFQHESEMI